MGIQPSEFWRMSMWQFVAVQTYRQAAQENAEAGLSEAEADDIWTWMQEKPETVRSPAEGARAH